MKLKSYFESAKGIGVLSTSDDEGHVNAAIYSRPHFTESGKIAFIMNERLSHANLQSNPNAVFLFKEEGAYRGVRLYLKKSGEETDSELLKQLKRRKKYPNADPQEHRYLVFFKLEKLLPLIGDNKEDYPVT